MNESYAEHLISRKSPFYAPILTIVLGLCTAVSVFFCHDDGRARRDSHVWIWLSYLSLSQKYPC